MELLFIRHGLPLRIDEGDAAGPADPALSDLGHRQAAAVAAWLDHERLDALWVSPMRRARETAAPIAERLGLPVTVDDDIAEFDREALSYIPIEELKAANDPRWNEIPEQPEAFQATVVAAVERIIAAHPRQRVGGRVPRRRHQRLRRPRPGDRVTAVLPAVLHERLPRAGGEHRRAIHRQPQRDGPPPGPLSQDAQRGRSPRTDPLHIDPPHSRAGNVLAQLRGTCDQGTSLSLRTSPGRPRTRSPRMFLVISVVPPSMELARVRRNACWGLPHDMACSGRFIG